jgi:hypothetical protein
MGLLDDFPPGGWGGLLGTPIDRVPWQSPAPLLVPMTDSAGDAGGDPYRPAIAPPPAGTMPATMGGAPPPQWPVPNLTMQALRMKGVPEAHIAAAFDDPALMRQLINRTFGPASAATNPPPDPIGIGGDSQRDAWAGDAPRTSMNSTGSPADGPPALVQLAQYAPARPFLPPLPAPFNPGTPANKEWADGFIGSNIHAGRVIGDWIRGIFHNGRNDENDDNEEHAVRPPAGSRPINETPWSGDHTEIKDAVDAKPNSDVRISPSGKVWAQHPDGSWTNHGPAENFTGSGKPKGRRGKDRDRW